MFHYRFQKPYNLEKLNTELAMAQIPMVSMDLISEVEFQINTNIQLSNSQQITLQQVVAAHISVSTIEDEIANKILICRNFGIRMMARFGAGNVLAGYNDEIIDHIIDKTEKVMIAVGSGSLKAAIRAINRIEPDEYITTEKLKKFRNEIEDFLLMPRT